MDEEHVDEKEEIVPLAQKSSRAARRDRRGQKGDNSAAGQEEEIIDTTQSKRAKVDHTEQVSQLFGAKVVTHFDHSQKSLVFKMCNSLKDSQNKTTTDALWKRYMGLNERESLRKGTSEALISSKEELIQILENLETDNLVMYAAEDNQVILM